MTVLFIFPHPDDETIFSAGTILRHVSRGDKVVWVCASYGDRSGNSPDRSSYLFYLAYLILGNLRFLIFLQKVIVWWLSIFRKSDKNLLEIRKKEALRVSKILKASELIFLEIEDMRFGWKKEKLDEKIKKCVNYYKPQTIYTFYPNGITNHPDHINLSQSVLNAVRNMPSSSRPRLFGTTLPLDVAKKDKLPLLGTKMPVKEIALNNSELEKKIKAVKAYKSQNYLWGIFLEKKPHLLRKEYFAELS